MPNLIYYFPYKNTTTPMLNLKKQQVDKLTKIDRLLTVLEADNSREIKDIFSIFIFKI